MARITQVCSIDVSPCQSDALCGRRLAVQGSIRWAHVAQL
jgi:hypothetical protein